MRSGPCEQIPPCSGTVTSKRDKLGVFRITDEQTQQAKQLVKLCDGAEASPVFKRTVESADSIYSLEYRDTQTNHVGRRAACFTRDQNGNVRGTVNACNTTWTPTRSIPGASNNDAAFVQALTLRSDKRTGLRSHGEP
ncbi:hypothetical protein AYO20_11651 [Fonsecaea nubica]|uniref:Uncharacterized protein n=1 Tax=Fonsecaea nubica TaxID=856822 RepID=A0A178BQW6_9EURO|nr:hypothetical protein AYO20_11651 [Fonsecaea nubica]OAL19396.1 hypothetical protein AYO20_11651 [Fonsecaea nubica]